MFSLLFYAIFDLWPYIFHKNRGIYIKKFPANPCKLDIQYRHLLELRHKYKRARWACFYLSCMVGFEHTIRGFDPQQKGGITPVRHQRILQGSEAKRNNPSPSASNIEHPVVIPWDVLFRPISGGFCGQYY